MKGEVIAGTAIGLVVGFFIGFMVFVFVLPGIGGGGVFDESDYARITVFNGGTANEDLGDYRYTILYNYEGYGSSYEGIWVSSYGIYRNIPSIAGRYSVLDLHVVVDEVLNDYVVLLVKQAE